MTNSTPKSGKSTAKAAAAGNGAAASDFFAKSQKAAEDWFRAGAEAWTGNYGAWKSLNVESPAAFGDWEEVAEEGRENFDAWMASSTIAAEGMGAIAGKIADCMTASMTAGVSASRAMLECKDVQSLVEAQSEQARTAFDSWVSDSNTLTEMTTETAVKAAAPIGRRVNAVLDKAMKSAA
ncbi:MAG: phasin family protein [Alphaproteobacteria bacterium]|jgi:phasin family protein|nr:phasin family protein [Alphaproteobacteria bacterium]